MSTAKFYLYRFKGRTHAYPNNWDLVSTHTTYAEAHEAAVALVPSGRGLYTEPSHKMDGRAGFFGTERGSGWSAMIETRDIHAERKAS